MAGILTISLNPALDSAADVKTVIAEVKLYCTNASLDAGGGGVNVSRAISFLGGDSTALVAVGGAMGNMLLDILAQEGVNVLRFDGPGQTRQNFAIREADTGKQYRFGQPGPDWSGADVSRVMAVIDQSITPDSIVVGSGSLPPQVPLGFYADVNRLVNAKAGLMVLDTGNSAMSGALENTLFPFHVLRMDRVESDKLSGRVLEAIPDAVYFSRSLILRDKAEIVVLARGAKGSLVVSGDDTFICAPPMVDVVSKVGAGDSFVAALTLGLSRGWPLRRAAQYGTAAAAAAVTTPGSALCQRAKVEEILAHVKTVDV